MSLHIRVKPGQRGQHGNGVGIPATARRCRNAAGLDGSAGWGAGGEFDKYYAGAGACSSGGVAAAAVVAGGLWR